MPSPRARQTAPTWSRPPSRLLSGFQRPRGPPFVIPATLALPCATLTKGALSAPHPDFPRGGFFQALTLQPE